MRQWLFSNICLKVCLLQAAGEHHHCKEIRKHGEIIYLLILEISAPLSTSGNKIRLEGQSALTPSMSYNIYVLYFIKTIEPFICLLQELTVEFKQRIDLAFQEKYDCSDL